MPFEEYFSIREVEQRTGVKPVTLRAWQRRYGLINPHRSEKGHRLYTEQDVLHIEQILHWLARGVAIGKVKALLDSAQQQTTEADTGEHEDTRACREMIELLANGSVSKVRDRLKECFELYPFDVAEQRLVTPVTQRVTDSAQPLAVAQRAIWRFERMLQYQFLVTAAPQSAARVVLLINLDFPGDIGAWQTAARLTSLGYKVNMLDGVGMVDRTIHRWILSQPGDSVAIFGNRKLDSETRTSLMALGQTGSRETLVFGEVAQIHLAEWRDAGAVAFSGNGK